MAKVQTRRNVSVSAETYARLKAYCDAQGVSMSGTVERIIKPVIAKGPVHEDLLASAQCSRCGGIARPNCCDSSPRITVIDEAKKLTPEDYATIQRFR